MLTVNVQSFGVKDSYPEEEPTFNELLINGETVERNYNIEGYRGKFFFEFLGEQYVLKLDPEGWSQSQNEFDLWNSIDKEDKKHFLPIVSYGTIEGQHYVIQKVVEFRGVPEKTLNRAWKKLSALAKKYRLMDDVQRYGSNDDKGLFYGRNWAYVKNTPVFYDYGINDSENSGRPKSTFGIYYDSGYAPDGIF